MLNSLTNFLLLILLVFTLNVSQVGSTKNVFNNEVQFFKNGVFYDEWGRALSGKPNFFNFIAMLPHTKWVEAEKLRIYRDTKTGKELNQKCVDNGLGFSGRCSQSLHKTLGNTMGGDFLIAWKAFIGILNATPIGTRYCVGDFQGKQLKNERQLKHSFCRYLPL